MKAALGVVNPAMSAKAVRLSVTVPGTPTLVSGDAERLQQVVWNLFSNAIKFTPSGGTVTVELKESGSEYVLTVEDTGMGISAEFLPFVFDRFRQADGTMTREHGGLGLGLAIVKDLTELHGGAVSATSPGKGRGARFSVRLPRLRRRTDCSDRRNASLSKGCRRETPLPVFACSRSTTIRMPWRSSPRR